MVWDARRLIRFYRDELQWCMCGQPEAPLGLLRDALRLRVEWHEIVQAGGCDYRENAAKEAALLPESAVAYLVWYTLDAHGLLEHGSSLPGWPTAKGYALLEALDRLGVDLDEWGSEDDWAFSEIVDGVERDLNGRRPEEHGHRGA